VVWSARFDTGDLGGWTATTPEAAVKWQVTTVQAISKPGSLYFGELPGLGYPGSPAAGAVTSPMITPPGGPAELWFQRNLDIEPIFSKDHISLEVITDGGETQIWDKTHGTGTGSGWLQVKLPLNVSGPFQLRFTFDSIDGISNASPPYDGVFIDDVELRAPCN